MAKSKFYAVARGRNTGIFTSWADCQKSVISYPGAIFKSFLNKEDAERFLKENTCSFSGESSPVKEDSPAKNTSPSLDDVGAYAYVDGSYNSKSKTYGFGGFLMANQGKYILQGCGNDKDMASMRNVSGEILGAVAAVKKSMELGLDRLTLYYDYLGIEMWARGLWKRNKEGTQSYHEFMQKAMTDISIEFKKVVGHSGVEGNEEADRLAKEAVGL